MVTSLTGSGVSVTPGPSSANPLAPGSGGTGTSTVFTAGSVVFAGPSGVYAQDNANLFWDDTNNFLGVGTNSPQFRGQFISSNGGATTTPLVIGNQATTNNTGVRLAFNLSSVVNQESSYIQAVRTNLVAGANYIGFFVNNGISIQEAVRFDDNYRLVSFFGRIKKVRVVTAAGAVAVNASSDHIVIVNKTVGAATTVNLPASPSTGLEMIIKDGKGDAAANNITVTPAAGNIDGAGTYVINTNYGVVQLVYNGTIWNVI